MGKLTELFYHLLHLSGYTLVCFTGFQSLAGVCRNLFCDSGNRFDSLDDLLIGRCQTCHQFIQLFYLLLDRIHLGGNLLEKQVEILSENGLRFAFKIDYRM